jgi:TldD protein
MPISNVDLDLVLNHAMDLGAEFCDIRLDSWTGFSVDLMQSTTRNAVASCGQGAGIRAFFDGAWGFASTTEVDQEALKACARNAIALARNGARLVKDEDNFKISDDIRFETGSFEITTQDDMDAFSDDEKMRLVSSLDAQARQESPLVQNVVIHLSDGIAESRFANSAGGRVDKAIGSIYLLANVIAFDAGNLQSGMELVSHIGGWQTVNQDKFAAAVHDATSQALRLLEAKPCPPGSFTIVADNKLGGVFTHEAMGHACEADAILAGNSILEHRIGERIGNEAVTIVDDGSRRDMFGYIPTDSEGVRSSRTVLIEGGILKSYLQDIETASRMGVPATGNGRAEAYDTVPQVRMTNTFLEPSDWDKDELIADTKQGIYCKNWQYGYVEPEKGNFMFKAKEAILIENGELTTLLKDAALSGQILQVLNDIDAIANDFGDSGGQCGKGGQSVRVSDASPHFRIRNVLVGGMEEEPEDEQ